MLVLVSRGAAPALDAARRFAQGGVGGTRTGGDRCVPMLL